MIIECERCKTKYRFDESSIEGKSAWLRCSRCRYVFSQDFPDRVMQEARSPGVRETDEALPDISAGKPSNEDILPGVEEFREAVEERDTMDIPLETWEEEDLEQVMDEPGGEDEIVPEREDKEARGGGGRSRILLAFYLLVAFLLAVGVYLWIFPQVRQDVIQVLSTLPVIDRLVVKKPFADDAAGPAQVALKDVRQRFVTNWLMGNLRIIEGTAINRAKYPVTRISIRGELYNASDVILAERIVSCGNTLSDQELGSLTEDEIQKELSQPQGSDVTNDRIEPAGQIPFMIVFAHEPPEVAKAMVAPVAAERLLQ